MKSELLSAEEARALLNYNPETGEFFWKVQRNNRTKAGSKAGSVDAQGYITIKISNKTYKAHRIAWLITYAEHPECQIDHIDHCRTNNRILNLRQATNQENHKNKSLRKVNTSGVTGVIRHCGKWQAKIGINGRHISLGHFESLEDAAHARELAEVLHGFHGNHGKKVGAE